MISGRNKNICWSFDNNDKDLQFLHSVIDTISDIDLVVIPDTDHFQIIDDNLPFLLFTSLSAEEKIASLSEEIKSYLANIPRAIILPQDYTMDHVVAALDAEVAEIIRPPFTTSRVEKVISKSLNASLVHEDIRCMTREILLEREIFERKNDILSFVVNFMESVSQSLDPAVILCNAFTALRKIFPAETMHAAYWKEVSGDNKEAIFYIDAETNSSTFTKWKDKLLNELTQVTGESKFSIMTYPLNISKEDKHIPHSNEYISLPIKLRNKNTGIVILVGEMNSALGRDQVESLETVMSYLGLALSNAGLYELVKQETETDSLTGLFNRRYCEKYFERDIKKIKRNKSSLSCIYMDIDHFKAINDTYGHNSGDIVLKELAYLIKSTLRETDYCARIGGEEFVIVLPETNEHQALVLAERLLSTINSHKFDLSTKIIKVTVSMGLSTTGNDSFKTKEQLMLEADTYLYDAKNAGRNCIRCESNTLQRKVINE